MNTNSIVTNIEDYDVPEMPELTGVYNFQRPAPSAFNDFNKENVPEKNNEFLQEHKQQPSLNEMFEVMEVKSQDKR